jgi:hypothetical protein
LKDENNDPLTQMRDKIVEIPGPINAIDDFNLEFISLLFKCLCLMVEMYSLLNMTPV